MFHYLKDNRSDVYFEQFSLEISGNIDRDIFTKAWNKVIEVNQMLRAVFRWEKVEHPVQIILKNHSIEPEFHDLSPQDAGIEEIGRVERRLEEIRRCDREKGFDLRDVPFRVLLCRIAGDKYLMVISNHHILYDGWSNGIILKEFFKGYRVFSNNESLSMAPKTGFKEFIKWNRNVNTAERETFWRDYLEGAVARTGFSIKHKTDGGRDDGAMAHLQFPLTGQLEKELEGLARVLKITPAAVLYSAWGILLQKYTNSEDVLLGATVSGRSAKIKGIEEMVGLFINTLPLRIQTHAHETPGDLFARTDAALRRQEAFEHTPLVDIKEFGIVDAEEELFDTIVIIENYPLDTEGLAGDGDLVPGAYGMVERTHYGLTVTIKTFKGLEIDLAYRKSAFDEGGMGMLAGHFQALVTHLLGQPGQKVVDIEVLSAAEKERILVEFNDTAVDYRGDKTIHQLFEERVERAPEAEAAVFKGKALTFRALNEKANQLAHLLRARGVGPNKLVGLMPERSLEMLVGLMGILKAGGAYIPLGPEYPQNRIALILEECGTDVLLVSDEKEAPDLVSQVINLEHFESLLEHNPEHNFEHSLVRNFQSNYESNVNNRGTAGPLGACNPAPLSGPSDLAYVIYTSGTTGKPKGVMIENRAVINFITGITDVVPFTAEDSILSLTTLSFDIFGLETLLALLQGTRVVLGGSEEQLNPVAIASLIETEGITIFQATPSRMQLIVSDVDASQKLKHLKHLLVGGEAFPEALLERLQEITGGKTTIYNVYGPTETTIWSTLKDVTGDRRLNIGKPIANTQVYILSDRQLLQPVGVVGELCIGGDGLARGYFKNEALTAERFVENGVVLGGKIYRTGDLARWLPDGNIDFLGRKDHQVKIRGFRIELGEIENRLQKNEGIKDAVVIVRGTGDDKYLCAYITVAGERGNSVPGLKDYLAEELPDYMVPAHFVQMDEFPLTANGKTDRKALPEPRLGSGAGVVAPRDETETLLVQLWAEVLGMAQTQISIDDKILSIGGHSLKAIRLANKMSKAFKMPISFPEVLKNPTIRELGKLIKKNHPDKYPLLEAAEMQEYYPLSSAQKRLYVQQQMDGNSTAYNMLGTVALDGLGSMEQIRGILGVLIKRHDSLRTSFMLVDGEPVQQVREEAVFEMETAEVPGDGQEAIQRSIRAFVRPFDLRHAPLIRALLVKRGEKKHLLVVDIYHIVSDGVSMQILLEEFSRLYTNGRLPALPLQYKDFSQWQNRLLASGGLAKQERYWLGRFNGKVPQLELPDLCSTPGDTFEGGVHDFFLKGEPCGAIYRLATETGTTLFMVLLAVYTILLSKYWDREDIVVGTPILGRNHGDLENIIGMFVNMLPMRNHPVRSNTFADFLEEVKQNALDAYENQDYQYEQLVWELAKKDPAQPRFSVNTVFVLENAADLTDGNSMENERAGDSGVEVKLFEETRRMSKFDLTLAVVEVNGGIHFELEYSKRKFEDGAIKGMAGHLVNILKEVSVNRGVKISEINMLSDEDKQKMINDIRGKKPAAGDTPERINETGKEEVKKLEVEFGF